MRRFLALLSLLFCSATVASRAQSVHWEGSDESSEVLLMFEDCAPDGDPRLPPIEDATLTLTGTSSQTTIANGSFSRTTILTYNAHARRLGTTLHIPAFTVQTSKGPLHVSSFTGGAPHVVTDATVNTRLEPGSDTVWAGEVFPLTYVLDAARRNFNQLASNIEWNPAPLVVEDWSKPEPAEVTANGEPRLNIVYKTRAYAKTAGPLVLSPAKQLVRIATGNIGFGLFQQPRVEELSVTTKRAEVSVRPLPTPPAGFTGAVGQFNLTSKVVPAAAVVGEPVTWTLELSGSGNWPDIAGLPQREVSKDFQVVQPQAKRTAAEGKLFDVTLSEDVVLVPTRPGTYVLNPVTFVYFDPKAGDYRTLSTPATTITITATTTSNAGAKAEPASAGPQLSAQNPPTAEKAEIPAPPAAIPRDPLADTTRALAPLPARRLVEVLTAPFAALLIFWAWLAVRRAQQTDPVRTRRAARARLAATLAHLRTAPEAKRSALLLDWQHDAAVLWEISHAAPPPGAFPEPAWVSLWVEADRTLYRANTKLAADWVARAESALAAKRVPGFSPVTALLPRNLLPFFFAVAVVALFVPTLGAEDAAVAYRRSDFPAAEKIWSEAVAKDPVVPALRHNLSLALAQQDRWDQAMGQATAAFVQNPASPAIRWQFALAGEKAGFLPAPLAAFPQPGPLQTLARQASPACWQWTLLTAAAAFALALGLLLYGAYHQPSRLRRWSAATLLVLAGLSATASILGSRAYGLTADDRAVIVWHGSILRSIPTEADTTQKTTTLAAGSIGLVDKEFLDWRRLTFDNGQTGWVRKDDLIALWR